MVNDHSGYSHFPSPCSCWRTGTDSSLRISTLLISPLDLWGEGDVLLVELHLSGVLDCGVLLLVVLELSLGDFHGSCLLLVPLGEVFIANIHTNIHLTISGNKLGVIGSHGGLFFWGSPF